MSEACTGTLYLVPTPIGNLQDITLRALEVLKGVDLIAAEDTRHARILLDRHAIQTAITSYHEHNERSKAPELISQIQSGKSIAIITDAGMPCISDPGFHVLQAAREANIPVTVLPGPSSVITAFAASGFGGGSFYFGGFLPPKSGGRQTELEAARDRSCASIYFESPHRIQKSMHVLQEIAPERAIFIAREMTKHFEEYLHGSPADLLTALNARDAIKGEFVLVISGLTKREAREQTKR